MNTQQLIDTITTLQLDGKEVSLVVLPSQVNRKRRIMFRGNKTCN